MDYNQKEYQNFKIKKYLKNINFFLIYHSMKLNSEDWLTIEQSLKKLTLKQYKILSTISSKIVSNSLLKNYSKLICGLVLLLKPEFNKFNITLNKLKKELKGLFVLLSIKLNDKIYLVSQVSKMKTFLFKQNLLNLHKVMEKSMKTIYGLEKHNSKQCDLNT